VYATSKLMSEQAGDISTLADPGRRFSGLISAEKLMYGLRKSYKILTVSVFKYRNLFRKFLDPPLHLPLAMQIS